MTPLVIVTPTPAPAPSPAPVTKPALLKATVTTPRAPAVDEPTPQT